jgi:hypothetical protein
MMGLDVLKYQTVNGMPKELIVFALIYNLVRLVGIQKQQGLRALVRPLRPKRIIEDLGDGVGARGRDDSLIQLGLV